MSHKSDLKVGDTVKILKFNRDGIILEFVPKDSIRVSLGNLAMVVSLDAVQKVSSAPSEKKRGKKRSNMQSFSIESSTDQNIESEEIDLHGYTVDQALTSLEEKINRAILARKYRIRVVHGLGSGRLKEAIHSFLTRTSYVSSFNLDEFNPGVTWIFL